MFFLRDEATGELTFLQVIKDGDPDGMGGTIMMNIDIANIPVVSPNSKFLIQAAIDDEVFNVFSIDGTTGMLTLVQVIQDGSPDGMGGTLDQLSTEGADIPVFSPNGEFVYLIGSGDDALNVFGAPSCPDFSSVTPNLPAITESTCTVVGGPASAGNIAAPSNNCPSGSTLQYSVDDGAFSTSVPVYDNSSKQKIETTCICEFDDTVTSDTSMVMTMPEACPISATTSGISASDPW